MNDKMKTEQMIKKCYSTWGERYYSEYYESQNSYPPVHTTLIQNLISEEKPKTLLDAGCGPASMLRDLQKEGVNRYGFDLTPEMVREAKNVFQAQGEDPSRIWEGSVTNINSFQHHESQLKTFDSVICFGVMPHVEEEKEELILNNLYSSVNPGGWVAVEARNELFGLYTMNRYTFELFQEKLIDVSNLKQKYPEAETKIDKALDELSQRFRLDLPPVRKGYEDEPGYDEVLSRTHNPFELKEKAEKAGFKEVKVLFYHFHAIPPMLSYHLPDIFRKESIEMENPNDWRGHFLASAFVLFGRKLG